MHVGVLIKLRRNIMFRSNTKSLYVKICFGVLSAWLALFSLTSHAEDTLYKRLGGTYNIAQTVDYLVNLIYENDGLNANPALKNVHDNVSTKAGFKVMLTNWVVQETGGPKIYQPDPFGRGKSMKDSHPHLNISNREFDIIKTLCLTTFYKFNIPNHEIDQLMDDLETYRKQIVTRKDEEKFQSRLYKDGVTYR